MSWACVGLAHTHSNIYPPTHTHMASYPSNCQPKFHHQQPHKPFSQWQPTQKYESQIHVQTKHRNFKNLRESNHVKFIKPKTKRPNPNTNNHNNQNYRTKSMTQRAKIKEHQTSQIDTQMPLTTGARNPLLRNTTQGRDATKVPLNRTGDMANSVWYNTQ